MNAERTIRTSILIGSVLTLAACNEANIPTVEVGPGTLEIQIQTQGELAAVRSRTITRPREGWSQSPIVELVPEGTRVETGDFLVRFDSSEAERVLSEKQAALENARASLTAERAQARTRQAQAESALRSRELDHEQARLRLQQMEYEAEARRREQEIELRKAELALEEARQKVESQRAVDAATLRKAEIAVEQARAEVERAERTLANQTLTAPIDGLVVYRTIWKGGGRGKVAVGDTPWPGQELLEIPDLSEMLVRTRVDEADIHRVAVDLPATVRIDALEGIELAGHVSRIATLAREAEGSEVKTFDTEIHIDTADERLRPGMTAEVRILVARHEGVLTLPLEAVFERDGENVCFVEGDEDRPRPIELGDRSADAVIVLDGLRAGERVLLRDPASPPQEIGEDLPGGETTS